MASPLLATLADLIRKLVSDDAVPPRIAFLGYPDLTADPQDYEALFGAGACGRLVNRDNAERIRHIHGRPQAAIVPTIESLIALITPRPVAIDVLDFQTYVGNEILVDLNEPVDGSLHGRYGVVFDLGTLEHVFDIAQAFVSCAAMTAVGGHVVHALPLNAFNHGFWNINPTAYKDFHEDNGFESVTMKINPWHSSELLDAPDMERFTINSTASANVIYVARRVEARARLHKPIQRRYRDATPWC